MFWLNAGGIIAAAFLTIAGGAWWRRYRSAVSLAEARTALKTCEQLLDLLAHLQQHRGMCSAWLGGDASFKARIGNKREEIRNVLMAVAQAAAAETDRRCPCFTANDLSLFRFKWQALIDKLHELTVEQCIAEHCHLIATVLDWLATYGEARIELPMGRVLPPEIVRNFRHRLPALAECLGQARAIGLAAAVRGSCSPVGRVRLMFLTARAESLLQQSMPETGNDIACTAARQSVEELIGIIRREMLGASEIKVSVDGYFTKATSAIDAVFAWTRQCCATLDAELLGLGSIGLPMIGTPTGRAC